MADIVTMEDCLAAGYCGTGVRRAVHAAGLDFRKLMTTGIPLDEWSLVEDAQFARVARIAQARGAT